MESESGTECVTWNDVVGQTRLTDNLQSAIKHNKISHAYLIEGERLSGKRMIADILRERCNANVIERIPNSRHHFFHWECLRITNKQIKQILANK